jgi:hypothetical protein
MKLSGTITVPLAPDQAIALFTPEGEREWVPHWDPQHHSTTVFSTEHAGDRTTWIVLAAGPEAVRYARVRPDHHAGTVEVRCRAHGTGTAATVTYDLTPLADHALDEFAAGYDAMLAEWERMIAEACTASR